MEHHTIINCIIHVYTADIFMNNLKEANRTQLDEPVLAGWDSLKSRLFSMTSAKRVSTTPPLVSLLANCVVTMIWRENIHALLAYHRM